jgi:hypothetical protein
MAGTAVLAGVLAVVATQPAGRAVPPHGRIVAALKGCRCVASDSAAALVIADVLSRDLRNGCRVVVDVSGLSYDLPNSRLGSGSTVRARRHDPVWQREIAGYFAQADAVIIVAMHTNGMRAGVLGDLRAQPASLQHKHFAVLVRSP